MYTSDLRRNPRRSEDFPRRRDQRCGYVYGTCEEEDGDEFGCGVCVEEAGADALWVWWIDGVFGGAWGWGMGDDGLDG